MEAARGVLRLDAVVVHTGERLPVEVAARRLVTLCSAAFHVGPRSSRSAAELLDERPDRSSRPALATPEGALDCRQ